MHENGHSCCATWTWDKSPRCEEMCLFYLATSPSPVHPRSLALVLVLPSKHETTTCAKGWCEQLLQERINHPLQAPYNSRQVRAVLGLARSSRGVCCGVWSIHSAFLFAWTPVMRRCEEISNVQMQPVIDTDLVFSQRLACLCSVRAQPELREPVYLT